MGLDSLDRYADQLPNIKLGVHLVQFLLAFVIFAIEIAVFRAPDSLINSKNGWTFAVCFLSIPAWIYLIMAPRFPRTRRLANAHAMAVVDGIFVVFWLSAFASQAAYNTANQCGSACGLSKAIVGLGVFVWLLFILTTLMSLYTVQYYSNNAELPGYGKIVAKNSPLRFGGTGGHATDIDPDKAAFSMAPADEEAYMPVGNNDYDDGPTPYSGSGYGGTGGGMNMSGASSSQATPYRNNNSGSHGSNVNPFDSHAAAAAAAPADIVVGPQYGRDEDDYGRSQSHNGAGSRHSSYGQPSSGSGQPAYDEPARFPAGNYDRTMR